VKALATCVLAILAIAVGVSACGSGETTTVEQTNSAVELKKAELEKETAEIQAEAAKAKQAAAKQAKQAVKHVSKTAPVAGEPEEAPNTVGERLPQAREELERAGFEVKAENTDTSFGIIIESHYTICEQSDPADGVVRVLAQKYGC
jgi:sRNA-binding protein